MTWHMYSTSVSSPYLHFHLYFNDVCCCCKFYLLGCFRIAYFIPALVQCTGWTTKFRCILCNHSKGYSNSDSESWSCRSHVTWWDGELHEAEMMIWRRIIIHHHVVVPGVSQVCVGSSNSDHSLRFSQLSWIIEIQTQLMTWKTLMWTVTRFILRC